MSVDRPTFSESWYRVSTLKPRLRSVVQSHRQKFRGKNWHVLQDPAANQFFRVNESAYRLIGLLDGARTINQAWEICNEQIGDLAPTQPEVIQLLGQLYTNNLLQGDLPPDAAGLFARHNKRKKREVQSYITNIMFLRMPLINPDRFLTNWVNALGAIFSKFGLILWMILISVGGYFLINRAGDLSNQADGILETSNLPLLYLAIIMIKVCHEFGHAFACKRCGLKSGGGNVNVMGIMLMVFTPMPYVDTSSSWAFKNKWNRMLVSAGGMYVELAIAAVAGIIWTQTHSGTMINSLCYNMIFIAGMSTILFNANPLIRYDGYYILSDFLEIANLSERSKQYLYYLVKKYAWGVKKAHSPANSRGEKIWFFIYGIASAIYRVFICVGIISFVADRFFNLGFIMAAVSIITWLIIPLGKFFKYLVTSGELMKTRTRSIASTAGFIIVLILFIGMFNFPDRSRLEGVVEPEKLMVVYAKADGFCGYCLKPNTKVEANNQVIYKSKNIQLESEYTQLKIKYNQVEKQYKQAQVNDIASAQIYKRQLESLKHKLTKLEERINSHNIFSKISGVWICSDAEKMKDRYFKRGQKLGMVADPDSLFIKCIVDQKEAPRLISELISAGMTSDLAQVEIRLKGRPDIKLTGNIVKIIEAGKRDLPSAALGYAAGGSIQTSSTDRKGTQAAEGFFEFHIKPNQQDIAKILSGQRVEVRISATAKPLIIQWIRGLRQLFQKRYRIL